METNTLSFVIAATGGEVVRECSAEAFDRVCTDSRTSQPGDLFIALAGERFDGHAFLDEVAAKGAAAVVIERSRIPDRLPDCGVVVVENTRSALGSLAAAHRAKFALPIIAVAGSNGKTTTKDLVASVLRQKLVTLSSEASFNNDIGVPLTLLRVERKHEALVLEVGTNHPGELAPLTRMIAPRFGVITCIGREHLEFFGDLEGVAQEEGTLAELVAGDGRVLLNGDDPWTPRIAARTHAPVLRVGLGEDNEWRARGVQLRSRFVTFDVEAPAREFDGEYRINLLGRHQVTNALFAIALGAGLGLTREEIRLGLEACEPPRMRLQSWETGGVRVLDDSYNANSDSMLAALRVLQELPCKGRRIAVLGDMAELGAHREAAHAEVGRYAAELGVAQLFAVGMMAGVMARGARQAGLTRVLEFAEVEAAGGALKTFLKAGDLVLVKASRATRLERVLEGLRKNDAAN